jgi:hypothetical protein
VACPAILLHALSLRQLAAATLIPATSIDMRGHGTAPAGSI